MSILRLFLLGLLVYFVVKAVGVFLRSISQSDSNVEVKGNRKKKHLDIDESDIEDADFRDIKDD